MWKDIRYIIGQTSRQVYKDLDKAWTEHIEHQADFYIDFNQAIINKHHDVEEEFNMTYTSIFDFG